MPAIQRILVILSLMLTVVACDDDDSISDRDSLYSITLNDSCDDGFGLQARLFDVSNDLVWPGGDQVFFTSAGGTIQADITCRTNALICYGATTDPETSVFWGIGLDGDRTCADCCDRCADINVSFDLGC